MYRTNYISLRLASPTHFIPLALHRFAIITIIRLKTLEGFATVANHNKGALLYSWFPRSLS